MRIGSETTYFIDNKTGMVDYNKMKLLGYDYCDYQGIVTGDSKKIFETGTYDEMLKIIRGDKEQIDIAGISVSQVHGPWITDDSTEQSRKRELELAKKAVRYTEALGGGKNLVMHPKMVAWYRETPENYKLNIEFFKELCNFALDYDVNVCIENMPFKELEVAYVKTIVKIVKEVNMKNFYICLDTGHANVCGEEIGNAIRMCAGKLKTLHIHDNKGEYDSHLLPYCGTIDWKSFKKALKDIGFDGVMSAETGISNNMPQPFKDEANITFAKLINSFWD